MHRSERNLDVRVGIMPTIHPIYRRNNLENNLRNNGISFSKQPVVFENKPTIAITKTKARATAKATAKAITKENLSSCQADKPPRERSFLFLDRMILVKRRASVQEAFALPLVHPLSFAFAQQLPQRWSRGRFAPGIYKTVSERYRYRGGSGSDVLVQGSWRHCPAALPQKGGMPLWHPSE